MEKVTKIIDVNAHIANVQAQVISDNDCAKAKISFENLGYGIITAVKFNAKGYNSFGDEVLVSGKNNFLIIIQDISVEENSSVEDIVVNLPNSEIRKIEIEECQICYANGDISTYKGKNEVVFELEEFTLEEQEIRTALRDVFDKKVTYNLLESEHGWICTCGRYNDNSNIKCSLCGHSKEELQSVLSEEGKQKAVESKKLLDEKRKEEAEQREKAKAKANKTKKIKIAVGIAVGLLFAILIGRSIVMSGRTTYSSEAEMKEALQGTYTYYDKYGDASKQIVISGDNVTFKWRYGNDLETSIEKWDYRNGKIHTFEDLVVTDREYLKDGDEIYEKGGYMSSNSSRSYLYESVYSALEFSNVRVSSDSFYTICTGTVTNNGSKTYKFVQIKGAFKDSSGTVLDIDSTYVVGSEGLAPGESKTFKMSVDKNYQIFTCSVSICDYD